MTTFNAPTLGTTYLGGPDSVSGPTAAVTIATGELLVVIAETSDSLRTLATPTGGSGISWTLQTSTVNVNFANMYVWTATAPSSQSFTLTITASGGNVGAKEAVFRLYRFTSHDGTGDIQITHSGSGTPSLALTEARDNSILLWHNVDWNDVAPGSPTYRTTGVGTATQDYLNQTAAATYYHVHHSSSGTAGAKTVGMTTPTAQAWTIAVVEVKGATATVALSDTGSSTDSLILRAGVPFLTAQLGPNARLSVQVAWGADVTAASSTWTWTDITTTVRMNPGISLRHGRSDEASATQPASCTLTLDNSTGAYSLGGQSPNWPYVRQNTPVRVRVDPNDGTGYRQLFIGYADSWQPSWNQSATVTEVILTASGILRRLAQQTSPVLSSLRRTLVMDPTVRAYWPLEDGRKSTLGASAIQGYPNMLVSTDTVNWAADTTSFDCSLQCPTFDLGMLSGDVPTYTDTHQWQMRTVVAFPDAGTGMVNEGPIMTGVTNNNGLKYLELRWLTGGGLRLVGLSSVLGVVFDSGAWSFGVNGKRGRLLVEMSQSGADVNWKLGFQEIGVPSAHAAPGTVLSQTLGIVTQVRLNGTSVHSGLTIGHAVLHDTITSIFTDYQQLNAYDGEASLVRFRRLCDENVIEHSEVGDTTPQTSITDLMGTQRPAALLSLLNDCMAVDGGYIFDGRVNAGLTYEGRRGIENHIATLDIDVAARKLGGPVQPVNDDQGRLNKMVVSRLDGAVAAYEDETGPMGTATVGIYDGSVTINCQSDKAPQHYARWLVHLGTQQGYRYPSIELDLPATPELIPTWLAIQPGQGIFLENVDTLIPQHPPGVVKLSVLGYSQTITPFSWTVTVNCAAETPWWIGRAAGDTGYLAVTVMRADGNASTLSASASIGATTLTVATSSGPVWTTLADDLPLTIQVGGIPVTVTNITSATSPQTFTVTGVTKALASGLAVSLDDPRVIGL